MKCFVNLAEKSFIGWPFSLLEGIAHLRTKTYLLLRKEHDNKAWDTKNATQIIKTNIKKGA